MAQKVVNPDPGQNFADRGVGVVATVDKNMRKTGYRPDAQFTTTTNSLDPDALVRVVNDSRLA